MAVPSPGYSLTLRVETPATITATSELAAAVGQGRRFDYRVGRDRIRP